MLYVAISDHATRSTVFRLRHPDIFVSDTATIQLNSQPWSLRDLMKQERRIRHDYDLVEELLHQAWDQ
jgi:hypothetical protein